MPTRIELVPVVLFATAGLCLAAAQPATSQQNPGAAAQAATAQNCPIDHDRLAAALKKSVKASGGPANGGFDTNEWASVVTRDGTVCAVAFSGDKAGDQWPGSRAISAEKATTANAFSLKQAAMSTANLYAGAQPGGFLFGITTTGPVAADVVTAGEASQFGTSSDPMLGKRVGGVVVFGGGLALYNEADVVGGLGVSGDSSCADHNVAWRVRHELGLDHVPAGPGGQKTDGIIYDLGLTGGKSGFGHPKCAGKEVEIATNIGAGADNRLLP